MKNGNLDLKIKPYLCTKELLLRLKHKKLMFDNENQYAEKIIEKFGYSFLIRNYRLVFYNQKHSIYYENATFEQIEQLMNFDISIKSSVLNTILHLEGIIKNVFAEAFSVISCDENIYLSRGHLQDNPAIVNSVLNDIKREKSMNMIRVNSYQEKGYSIPPWGLLQMLTLNTITRLFAILKKSQQDFISKKFHIDKSDFGTYLINLKHARNIIVHLDPLYSSKEFSELTLKYHQKYYSCIQNPIGKRKGLYTVLIVLKKLCNDYDNCMFNKLVLDINTELSKLRTKLQPEFYSKIIRVMQIQDNTIGINTYE